MSHRARLSSQLASQSNQSGQSFHLSGGRERDARYSRRLRRLVVFETAPDGTRLSILCRDQTRRPLGSTGTEGARREACELAKVPLVTVAEPLPDRRFAPGSQTRQDDMLARLHCIVYGVSLHPERGEDGHDVYVSLSRSEAVTRYGRWVQEACPRTAGTTG